jgi:hypothetical protein
VLRVVRHRRAAQQPHRRRAATTPPPHYRRAATASPPLYFPSFRPRCIFSWSRYLKQCIEPYILPPVSKEDPGVFVCDGVGVHITCDFLEYMIHKGWILVLRTPFCSDVLQGEDLVSFWALKYVTRARARD